MAPTARTVDWTKKTESFFGTFINLSTYAAIADTTRDHVADGENEKYDEATFQSFTNLQFEGDDRDKTVKNVFTVATEVKQFFRMILAKVVEDLKDSGCTSADTIDTITNKLSSDSYLTLVLNGASKYRPGKSVTSCIDSTMYLPGRIQGDLGEKFLDKMVLVTAVAQKFYDFIKHFSNVFAQWNWYNGDSMTENVVLGLFNVALGFTNEKIMELKDQKRPKVTKVVKKKVETVETTETVVDNGETEVTTTEVTTKVTTTPVVTTSIEDELNDI
jgi:hypothetical protein